MSKPENPFRTALDARKQAKQEETLIDPPAVEIDEPVIDHQTESPVKEMVQTPTVPPIQQPHKKRGRPPSGKRSDDAWVGRTFYIKRETDFDVEELLPRLRRQGIEIDKSELVEMLLSAWVKWHQGENLEIQLDEISPIQKS